MHNNLSVRFDDIKALEVVEAKDGDILYLWMGSFTIQLNTNRKASEGIERVNGHSNADFRSSRIELNKMHPYVESFSIFYGGRNEDF